ncbi:efflux RND transporter periplasmic adaptor subunit [Ancylobacter sp. TS-1]|uniref:efflux RND transporter periplasmic adaptor subunit n=1 Tax=Ancylobacter sp. TS-1 TaxID=1850374 RepID=UPI001265B490|nr:efflux RND transporter periplasmic adaptor subunit [Ancylobacter sp. TS-1]QFR34529.1 efflux RND transporter periplasmic adaptor subunit [Ancylobacter sp. TS-1]
MRGRSPLFHFLNAAAVSALAAMLAGCGPADSSQPEPEKARPVLARPIAFEPRVRERSLVGVIQARVESDLGFRVQGKVAKRLVNVGDAVHQGDALATLDEVDLGLQVEQAEAERNAALAARAQAEAEFQRAERLSKDGWTTASMLDTRRAAAEEAKGRLARAERSLDLAKNASSYAVLRADADGVITATAVEPGQVVQPGFAAIRLARTAEKEAVVSIPESIVQRARTAKAVVTLWSNADARYEATLREMSPAADAATRTYLARFPVPAAGPDVQLGMTATVTLTDPNSERIARLPFTALVDQGKGPFVWTVDPEGKLVAKPVTVATYEAKDVLVSGGLTEGDRVVLIGAQKLDVGVSVRAVDQFSF